jgi:hypothetical protein
MQIQPRDFVSRRQHCGQLQLCVPQVALKGASYRLRGKGIDSLPSIRTTSETEQ